jgi:hypothetical protein
MTLLEELVQKKEINVDFHNHGQTGHYFRKKEKGLWNSIKWLFLSEGFRDLPDFLDTLFNSNLDLIYKTNFSDWGFEEWTSKEQLDLARLAGYQVEQGEYYTFFKKNNVVKGVGKSQEVPTKLGHTLFAGVKRGKNLSDNKLLDETLKEVDDEELKIADHPFCGIKGQNGIMAYSKNREKDAKKFDAFEINGNFHLPFSFTNWRAVKYSKKYNIPLLANSDGHHPKDIGKCYNIFQSKDLKYSSEREFRDSINNSVRENKFETHYSPTPLYRIFHHALMIFIGRIFDKKKDNYQISKQYYQERKAA